MITSSTRLCSAAAAVGVRRVAGMPSRLVPTTAVARQPIRRFASSAVSSASSRSARRSLAPLIVLAAGMCAGSGVVLTKSKNRNSASIFDISEADVMHDHPQRYAPKDAYDLLKSLDDKHPKDVNIKWRLARAAYSYSEHPDTPKDLKQPLMTEALETIKAAEQLDNSVGDLHRWYGIILSGAGKYQSTKEYIANSFVIYSHWQQAVQLNSNDASAHHLIGRWCFDVASMPWWKRRMASTLFAEPPSATYEEALAMFNDAERISPGFWKMNRVMLAKVNLKLGNKEAAKEHVEAALKMRNQTAEDEEAHAEAENLAKQV